MKRFRYLLVVFAILVAAPLQLHAQKSPPIKAPAPMPSHDVVLHVDSGVVTNTGERPRVVWSRVISVKEAKWMRLQFRLLVLADDPNTGSQSTLTIRSLADGAEQVLTAETARQWQNTSAYFNGNAVQLELTAVPSERINWILVDQATAGDAPDPGGLSTSICDGNDDRLLSNDPRAGRTAPGGCTAWLFNDRANCMLTAGHCVSSASVIEFNVPLSNSDGSVNHPPPEDQYIIDSTSMQFVNGGVGNDWAYFGCFPNSNTGLTAFEAQGDSYQLELPQPVMQNDLIRITGYGTTSPPVNNTWNQAQKTHVGPHFSFSGSALGYRTDTTGGNSGSPVIFENDGTAIGIHTHGGCGNGGGNNNGTGANNAGFQNALANPLGVCQSSLAFDFPNGRPATVDPAGGTTMRVVVSSFGEDPQPGTGLLHVDRGNGYETFSMNQVSDNVYDAVFPTTTCGTIVNYYVSAEDTDGDLFTDPSDAPSSFYSAISAVSVLVSFEDDFESDTGWTVSGDALDGQWDRGVPIGGGDRGDPSTDGDGSGQCYLTDNVDGNSDVDDGTTTLTSPTLDATVTGDDVAVVSYYRWYHNSFGNAPESDIFVVEISNNNGSSWTTLEVVGPSGSEVHGGWIQKSFLISDFVTPTDQMRVRFHASDLGDGSVVEAGIDGVKIEVIECGTSVVNADSVNVILGTNTQGELSDTFASDDDYLKYLSGNAVSPFDPSIILEFEGSLSNDSPSALAVLLESSVNTNGITQAIEMFNFNTGQYEEVDSRLTSLNNDTVAQVDLTGDVTRFVEAGSGTVRARISYTDDGTGFLIAWTVCIDQFGWIEQ